MGRKKRFKQAKLLKKAKLTRKQWLGFGNKDSELTAEEMKQKNHWLKFDEMLKGNIGLLMAKNSNLNDNFFYDCIPEDEERNIQRLWERT